MTDAPLQFESLGALHWLWLVVGVSALAAWGIVARRRRLARFASEAVLSRLLPTAGRGGAVVRAALLLAAMIAIVLALLDPRWGVSYEEVQQQGIDLFVVLDVSRSMLAEDARPSRLERARQYIGDLLEQLGGDRVGLITVAGNATLACPLTLDYGAVRLSLAEVSTSSAARGGSLVGDALRLAADSFTDDVPDHKAVIVFTDGEDHGSYPVEAARQLFEQRGVRVYTVGIGDDEEGARIPIEGEGRTVYLVHEGQEVWTTMDKALLRQMALAAGGAFVPVGTGTVDMGRVYREVVAPTTRREFGMTRIRRLHVQYQWFAGAALLLLLAESAIAARRVATRRREDAAPGRMAA